MKISKWNNPKFRGDIYAEYLIVYNSEMDSISYGNTVPISSSVGLANWMIFLALKNNNFWKNDLKLIYKRLKVEVKFDI